MQALEQTLDSREVAGMVKKDHSKLLRDIRTYIEHLTEAKIGFSDFFKDSEYKDCTGRTLPCYKITLKGCEFIAHKMTGQKGTEFTARYINRFHEMQEIISKQEPELPWFIRKFLGRYIVLERDFITITGVDIGGRRPFYKEEYFTAGIDWNGYGWKCNKEEFREKYGFDYGNDDCMIYFHLIGVIKALRILQNDKIVHMNPGAYELLQSGVNKLLMHKAQKVKQERPKEIKIMEDSKACAPIQVNIMITENGLRLIDTNVVSENVC